MERCLFPLLAAALCLCSCSGPRGGGFVPYGSSSGAMEYAHYLKIENRDSYNIVTILNPWDSVKVLGRYLLVDRNTEPPEEMPEGTVIKVPVERAAVYSSVHSSIISQIGAVDALAGVCETGCLTSEAVIERVSSGLAADLGMSSSPDVEKIIDIDAEIIIASPFENGSYGAAEKTGIPIVEGADYMESHPLGKAEWLKFYGLLFGRQETADSLFNAVKKNYNDLKSLTQGVTHRPTVLLEKRYGGVWSVPGGDSYIGTMHSDAGADYIFSDLAGTASRNLSFESVYDRAADADFWLMKVDGNVTYGSLASEYEPYTNFKAFGERRIYNCNTLKTSYYDDITIHPDRILEDFIRIYHPGLLEDSVQKYYFPIDE